MESFKDVSSRLKRDPTLTRQLRLAISVGRTVLVDRLLREHPDLFYPTLCLCHAPHFVESHPLEYLGPTHNLEMFHVVWSHFVSHSFTTLQLQQLRAPHPLHLDEKWHNSYCEQRYKEARVEEVRQRAIECCAHRIFNAGDAPMLQLLFSLAPEAEVYMQNNINSFWFTGVSLEVLILLEEKGIIFGVETVQKALRSSELLPIARWLMERVQGWQGSDQVLGSFFHLPTITREARGFLKTLLLEADKSNNAFNWLMHLKSCIQMAGVDRKAVKWLWRRYATKDIRLAFWSREITMKGDTDFFYFLLKLGAIDVNATHPDRGRTLLHLAVEKNYVNLVTELLKCGVNPRIGDSGGRTPLKLAKSRAIRTLLTAEWKNRASDPDEDEKQEKEEEEDVEEEEEEKVKTPTKKKRRKTDADEVEKQEKEEEDVEEEVKTPAKKKRRKTDEGQTEEERIGELLRRISEANPKARDSLFDICKAHEEGLTVFSLRQICRRLGLYRSSQRKADMTRSVIEYLEAKLEKRTQSK